MLKFIKGLFSRSYPKVLDEVNTQVNRSITYTSDAEQYKVGDLWVASPISHKGDCEDYVLTKQNQLISKGISPQDLSMYLCFYLKPFGEPQGHAVLLYKDEWVLDNRTDIIWRKRQAPYTGWTKEFTKKAIYNGKP